MIWRLQHVATDFYMRRALATLEDLRSRRNQFALAADGGPLLVRIRRIAARPSAAHANDRHWLLGISLSVQLPVRWRSPAIPRLRRAVRRTNRARMPTHSAKAERVLRFPSNRTMGIVYWRKVPAKPEDRLDMYCDDWKEIGEARGEVHVPAGGEVRLQISKAASSDMSGLDQLLPDQIQAFDCRETNLNDEGMRHVGRLTGLKILYVFDTPITDACAASFAGLKNLRLVRLEACTVSLKGSACEMACSKCSEPCHDWKRSACATRT